MEQVELVGDVCLTIDPLQGGEAICYNHYDECKWDRKELAEMIVIVEQNGAKQRCNEVGYAVLKYMILMQEQQYREIET